MATLKFKSKVTSVFNHDSTLAYRYISIPVFSRSHCVMSAMRQHPKLGQYANSDLFPALLARERKRIFGDSVMLRLDRVPEGVTLDTSGFLAVASMEI